MGRYDAEPIGLGDEPACILLVARRRRRRVAMGARSTRDARHRPPETRPAGTFRALRDEDLLARAPNPHSSALEARARPILRAPGDSEHTQGQPDRVRSVVRRTRASERERNVHFVTSQQE